MVGISPGGNSHSTLSKVGLIDRSDGLMQLAQIHVAKPTDESAFMTDAMVGSTSINASD
jgi:hypothetical protein